jgi:hypothetical protein
MVLFEAKARASEEFQQTAQRFRVADDFLATAAQKSAMPQAMTPLPRRAVGTAANYLWWLQRPAALRSLPVPTEAITDLLSRYRRSE